MNLGIRSKPFYSRYGGVISTKSLDYCCRKKETLDTTEGEGENLERKQHRTYQSGKGQKYLGDKKAACCDGGL